METIRDHERQHHCIVTGTEHTPDGDRIVACATLLNPRRICAPCSLYCRLAELVTLPNGSPGYVELPWSGMMRAQCRRGHELWERVMHENADTCYSEIGAMRCPRTEETARALEAFVDGVLDRRGAIPWLK